MRTTLLASFFAAAFLAFAPAAHGFCIYNDMADADVQAALLPAQASFTGKVYREKVGPGKESCCNPKNAECNPDRVLDTANVTFEARIVPRARGPKTVDLGCGKPSTNPRIKSRVEAVVPLRGNLRFEPNARFDRARPEGSANPRYVMRILSPQNVQVAIFACFPGAPA